MPYEGPNGGYNDPNDDSVYERYKYGTKAGAAYGSAFGPWGALIGGIGGGVSSLKGADNPFLKGVGFMADPAGIFERGPTRVETAEQLYGGVDPGGQYGAVAGDAAAFGQQGAAGYGQLGEELAQQRRFLEGQARGKNSVSAEQLRQGLQQNVAAQQSMAAGASPQNAAMAARTASMNAARLGGGLAGQQSIAGLQERQLAQQALSNLNLGQRQQDLQATLGGQQNALSGYGGIEQNRTDRYTAVAKEPNQTDQEAGLMSGLGGGMMGGAGKMFSDRRLKTGIKDGGEEADDFLRALKSYRFRYKNPRHGKGELLGIMTDDLKRTKAGRAAVIETDEGDMVDGARLAAALAATLPRLDKRLRKVEGSRK